MSGSWCQKIGNINVNKTSNCYDRSTAFFKHGDWSLPAKIINHKDVKHKAISFSLFLNSIVPLFLPIPLNTDIKYLKTPDCILNAMAKWEKQFQSLNETRRKWTRSRGKNWTLKQFPAHTPILIIFQCMRLWMIKTSNFKRALALGIEESFWKVESRTKLFQDISSKVLNCTIVYKGPISTINDFRGLPNIRCNIRRCGHYTYRPFDI